MIKLNYIIDSLNLSENFKKLVFGDIDIPYINDGYQNVHKEKPMFFFPPMLIPLFVDYSLPNYKGIIIHPFSDKRANTFIYYNIEDDNILEIAINEKQFLTLMILEMNMIIEGLNDKINIFCNKLNFSFAEKIDAHAEKFGDDSTFFNQLIYLEDSLPLSYCQSISQYKENYPSSKDLININVIKQASSYELHQKQLPLLNEEPLWLKLNADLYSLFNDYIQKEEYECAWFTLNSRGWDIDKQAKSLDLLNKKVTNPLLSLISENWLKNYTYFR